MANPGDVVTVDFPGTQETKRRPAVVISTDVYHRTRPDVILGLLTTNLDTATMPTDFILQDWKVAGLHSPSAFRAFLVTLPVAGLVHIGHLSERDWRQVQARVRRAIELG